MTNYAKIEGKGAALSGDFGYAFAVRRFGQALVDIIPLYSRGPRKGLTKGYIVWDKVTKGGWKKDGPGYMNGGVVAPGTRNVRLCWDYYGDQTLCNGPRYEGETADVYAARVVPNLRANFPNIKWRETAHA